MMFASPMSPAVENLTLSLVTLMDTVSPMVAKSLQMRWNSTDGILMVTAYSVSGIPKCSLSMSMSFNSKSEIFSWPASFRLVSPSLARRLSRRVAVTIAPIASRTRRLKHKRHDITGIVRFHGDRVVVTGPNIFACARFKIPTNSQSPSSRSSVRAPSSSRARRRVHARRAMHKNHTRAFHHPPTRASTDSTR